MDFSQLMGTAKSAVPGGSLMTKFGRGVGGTMSGFGQGLMDQKMRRTYGTARAGGYQDLMQDQQIGDFIRGRQPTDRRTDMESGMRTRQMIEELLGGGRRF